MGCNSFGKEFVVTCFGESHGKCVGVIVDGCPAGLPLSEADIQTELDKRRAGFSTLTTARKEEDKVKILSGVFNNRSTGAPICMIIVNKDIDSKPYEAIRMKPRPGHADYTAFVKYGGFSDYRGGGRFSGRITACFVMAGAIAKKLLATKGIEILAHVIQVGRVKLDRKPSLDEIRGAYQNDVRCADQKIAKEMEEEIRKAQLEGDSIGGVVEGIALNVPAGIGEPIFDSLDADLAKLLFDIPGVKGVEFGVGFKAAEMRGSEYVDFFTVKNGKVITETNNAGGILGGISNGMPIIVRVAFKPASSISKKVKTVDLQKMEETELEFVGRYDPCIAIRAVPVVESVMAIVLADHMLRSQILPRVIKP